MATALVLASCPLLPPWHSLPRPEVSARDREEAGVHISCAAAECTHSARCLVG